MNFRYKLMQFMSGRYGIDSLFYVLFFVAATIALINCFLRLWFLQISVYVIVLYSFFRVFSRNISARQRENKIVGTRLFDLKEKMEISRRRSADKMHIYKKCPHCGAVLRLPRRKGKHKTVCPKCAKEFSVRVYREY